MCPLDRRFVASIVILEEPPDVHGGGLEAIARENGAVPATTLIVDGVPHIGKFFKFLNWFTGQRHAGHPPRGSAPTCLATASSRDDNLDTRHGSQCPRNLSLYYQNQKLTALWIFGDHQ